jgi:hypothetical protein
VDLKTPAVIEPTPVSAEFHFHNNPTSPLLVTALTDQGQVIAFYGSEIGGSIQIEIIEVIEEGQSTIVSLDEASRPFLVETATGDRVELVWSPTTVTVLVTAEGGSTFSSGEIALNTGDQLSPFKMLNARQSGAQHKKKTPNKEADTLVEVIAHIRCEGVPQTGLDDIFIEVDAYGEDEDFLPEGVRLEAEDGFSRFPAIDQGSGRYVASIPVFRRSNDAREYCEQVKFAMDLTCRYADWPALSLGCIELIAAGPQAVTVCQTALLSMVLYCGTLGFGVPVPPESEVTLPNVGDLLGICEVFSNEEYLTVSVLRGDTYLETIETDTVSFSNLSAPLEISVTATCDDAAVCDCYELTLTNACVEGSPCNPGRWVKAIPAWETVIVIPNLPSPYSFVTWEVTPKDGPTFPQCFEAIELYNIDRDYDIIAYGARILGLNADIQVPWGHPSVSVSLDSELDWEPYEPSRWDISYQWYGTDPADQLVLSFDPRSGSTATTATILNPLVDDPYPVGFLVYCNNWSLRLRKDLNITVGACNFDAGVLQVTDYEQMNPYCYWSTTFQNTSEYTLHVGVSYVACCNPSFPCGSTCYGYLGCPTPYLFTLAPFESANRCITNCGVFPEGPHYLVDGFTVSVACGSDVFVPFTFPQWTNPLLQAPAESGPGSCRVR